MKWPLHWIRCEPIIFALPFLAFAACSAGEDHWLAENTDLQPVIELRRLSKHDRGGGEGLFSEDQRKATAYVLSALTGRILGVLEGEIGRDPEDIPYHEGAVEIEVQVGDDDSFTAYALQGEQPVIVINRGLLNKLSGEFDKTIEQHISKVDLTSFWAWKSQSIINGAITQLAAYQYLEALNFVLAHEVVHIWLDPPVKQGTTVSEKIAREVRADAYAIAALSELSPVTKERIGRRQHSAYMKMLRELMNSEDEEEQFAAKQIYTLLWTFYTLGDPCTGTMSLEWQSPEDLIRCVALFGAGYGADPFFALYQGTGFEQGNVTHLPLRERALLVQEKLAVIAPEVTLETVVEEWFDMVVPPFQPH